MTYHIKCSFSNHVARSSLHSELVGVDGQVASHAETRQRPELTLGENVPLSCNATGRVDTCRGDVQLAVVGRIVIAQDV